MKVTAEEVLERVYNEAEPITSAGLTPMGVSDASGYRLGMEIMEEIENCLQEFWSRKAEEEEQWGRQESAPAEEATNG